jgi:hypothetical protein
MEFERDPFNAYQNFLYKRALFGLSVYQEVELSTMHKDKKKRITKVHQRAQQVLNIWKQQLTNQWAAELMGKFFHHSNLVKEFAQNVADAIDPDYISNLEFKSLGVDKKQIVNKLIEEKVLPKDFYNLKAA